MNLAKDARRLTGLALVSLAGFGLAACGETKIDASKGEKTIQSNIEKVVGVTGVKVDCPDGKKAKKGDSFTCTATGADGSKATVNVFEKDDKGNVRFDAPLLHTKEAEDQLAKQVAGTNTGVKVDCQDLIVPKKDGTETCHATADGGKKVDIAVTFTDDQGHFNFKVKQ